MALNDEFVERVDGEHKKCDGKRQFHKWRWTAIDGSGDIVIIIIMINTSMISLTLANCYDDDVCDALKKYEDEVFGAWWAYWAQDWLLKFQAHQHHDQLHHSQRKTTPITALRWCKETLASRAWFRSKCSDNDFFELLEKFV